jgi:hypothetical protein
MKRVLYNESGLFIDDEKICSKEEINIELIDKLIEKYSKNVDFKSLSHAVRVVDEVKELLSEEFVTFPLKNAQYVKEVKMGLHPVEDVVNKLENDMSVVENLLFSTKLPLQVNEELVMSLLLEVINTRS